MKKAKILKVGIATDKMITGWEFSHTGGRAGAYTPEELKKIYENHLKKQKK